MADHPLTDDIIEDLRYRSDDMDGDMRTAYDLGVKAQCRDDQLKQVINWLHDNLDDYSTDTDPGFFWPMSKLLPDLEKAMRPATQEILTDQDLTDALENQDLEDQEDLRLVMERRNGPTTRLTLEELSMRPATTQENN